MAQVVGVRFKANGKTYYFAPNGLDIENGEKVIVETSRGIEFGNVVIGKKEVEDEKITKPLKDVIRIATSEDIATYEENKEKEKEAFSI